MELFHLYSVLNWDMWKPPENCPRENCPQENYFSENFPPGKLPLRKSLTTLPTGTFPLLDNSKENIHLGKLHGHERFSFKKIHRKFCHRKFFQTFLRKLSPGKLLLEKGPYWSLSFKELTWRKTVPQKLSLRPIKLLLCKTSFGILSPSRKFFQTISEP